MNFGSSSDSDSEGETQDFTSVIVYGAALVGVLALTSRQTRKNPSIWVAPYLKERQNKGRFVIDAIFFPSHKINVL